MGDIIIQNIGRVYIFLPFLKALKIGETIEKYVKDKGDVEIGRIAEIMILNRACGFNTPLYKISEWAKQHGIEQIYGCESEKLNDDRIGDVFDQLYDKMVDLDAEITMNIIKNFDIDLSEVHFDPTSIPIVGKVLPRSGETKVIKAKYGRSSEGHTQKQVRLSLAVTGEEAIPLIGQSHDGNAADCTMHPEALERLRKIIQPCKFLFVGDSKFDCIANLLNIFAHDGKFLCPGVISAKQKQIFLNMLEESNVNWEKLDYVSKQDSKKTMSKRPCYKSFEQTESIRSKVNGSLRDYEYRLIFIHSSQNAKQHKETRLKYINKISKELELVKKRLNKDKYRTKSYVQKKVIEIFKINSSVAKMFNFDISEANGKLIFNYSLNDEILQQEEKLDGIYTLKTNLDKEQYPMNKVLETYKKQSRIEDRFKAIKNIIASSPILLKLPKRIAVLLFIIVQALKLYCLLEHETRKASEKQPLAILPENRTTFRPTGETILRAFDYGIHIIQFSKNRRILKILSNLNKIQKKILSLLLIPVMNFHNLSRRYGKFSYSHTFL